jgi:hypothetical protein
MSSVRLHKPGKEKRNKDDIHARHNSFYSKESEKNNSGLLKFLFFPKRRISRDFFGKKGSMIFHFVFVIGAAFWLS